MSDTLDDWFTREILPHEAALLRYLARVCPNPSDIQDIRHDAYVRILEAADRFRAVSPKALLFKTARHLIIDRARRSRIVPIDLREDLDDLDILVDEITPERQASTQQQLDTLSKAFNGLPEKCREVLWLRRVEGLSQKEMAAKLGIAEGTVEKHLMRAARLLAEVLTEPKAMGSVAAMSVAGNGKHHGK